MISNSNKNGLRRTVLAAIGLMAWVVCSPVMAVSVTEKAKEKLTQNREYIVELEIILENFGTDEQKAEYAEIKDGYLAGLSYFLQKKYAGSYSKLLEAQKRLEKLYEQLSMDYIERTNEMLHNVAKQYVDINIKYDYNSELVARYEKTREPPDEKLSYDPKNYHLYYDKYDIYNNINVGYSRLGDAERVRTYAMELEKWYEEGKEMDPSVHSTRIEHYSIAINLCREAKRNVIRAYQLMNRNDIYTVQTEFADNRFAIEKHLDPVFDPRIPDEYKVDASDALRRIHANEIYVKIEGKGGEREKKEVPPSSSSSNSGAAGSADNGAATGAPGSDSQ